jgi:protein-tyrosine phosphatase
VNKSNDRADDITDGATPALSPGDAPPRSLGLEGSPNFRDAGGYARRGGSPLAWRRLFRSGHLALLSPADRHRLAGLELELVCDLRREDEQRLEPSQLPGNVKVISANITPGSQASAIYDDSRQIAGAAAMFQFMCDINREFVDSQTDAYREVFAQLLDSGAQRVLLHCSAGKDRTGFAIAMLQLALGVTLADVEADYLLSRRYYLPEREMSRVRKKYPVDHLQDEQLVPMMRTELDYLRSAMAAIEIRFGDIERYLAEGLGLGALERRELQRRFAPGP